MNWFGALWHKLVELESFIHTLEVSVTPLTSLVAAFTQLLTYAQKLLLGMHKTVSVLRAWHEGRVLLFALKKIAIGSIV